MTRPVFYFRWYRAGSSTITKLGPEPPIGEFMLPPILCPQ